LINILRSLTSCRGEVGHECRRGLAVLTDAALRFTVALARKKLAFAGNAGIFIS